MATSLDLGHLMITDTDPVSLSESKTDLLARALKNFNYLKNALASLPRSTDEEGVSVELPKPNLILPKAFPLPIPKSERQLTKWQAFAKKKGIKPKKKRSSHVYDDKISKDWRPRHGSKSAKNDSLSNWVEELN